MNKYTYADLLKDLSKLTPEQLAYEVRWVGDERGGRIAQLDIMEEDFVAPTGVWEPLSAYVNIDGTLTEMGHEFVDNENEHDPENFPIVAHKGEPMLAEP